jgi:hypothetical protein
MSLQLDCQQDVLDPWYGQAVVSEVKPFASHDPRTLFPTLPEAGLEALGIDADEPHLACPLLGRDLPNPYYFLRHRWDSLLHRTEAWAAGVTHGDLNFNNVLVDGRRNIYVIDFSETRIRNVASDFARLEPIGLLQYTRLTDATDRVAILKVVAASLHSPIWKMPPAPPEAVDPLLLRAITLAAELRALAATRVAEPSHEAAYLMPLLEWTIPIIAFRQIERERKQLALAFAMVNATQITESGQPAARRERRSGTRSLALPFPQNSRPGHWRSPAPAWRRPGR